MMRSTGCCETWSLVPVAVIAVATLSCAGAMEPAGSDTSGTSGKTPALVEVTVVSADIQGHMANGEQWDNKDDRKSGSLPPALARYFALHPELEDTMDTVGVPIDDSDLLKRARDSKAADPMVLIDVADQVFRSPVRPRAFHPVWDFSFQLSGTVLSGARQESGAPAHVYVVDYDGPDRFDVIGSTVLPVDTMLSQPIHEFGPFGAVEKLIVQVRKMPAPAHDPGGEGTRLAIPARTSWTNTGVEVYAGQIVHITAADEVCTNVHKDETCTGPEGQSQPHDANLPGFKSLGHGALVGAIGDTRFRVGRELQFVAPATGTLHLGVNDRDTVNNRGSYAVHILVRPPL